MTGKETGEDDGFKASAAALLASHMMAEAVWGTYFDDLPRDQPELRMVLFDLHRSALMGERHNISEATDAIRERFGVAVNTAKKWLHDLEDMGFLVRVDGDRTGEKHLLPSRETKEGLRKVGQEYLYCLRLAASTLRSYGRGSSPKELDWLEDVKTAVRGQLEDYDTLSGR